MKCLHIKFEDFCRLLNIGINVYDDNLNDSLIIKRINDPKYYSESDSGIFYYFKSEEDMILFKLKYNL
jgi:hypothetical protein